MNNNIDNNTVYEQDMLVDWLDFYFLNISPSSSPQNSPSTSPQASTANVSVLSRSPSLRAPTFVHLCESLRQVQQIQDKKLNGACRDMQTWSAKRIMAKKLTLSELLEFDLASKVLDSGKEGSQYLQRVLGVDNCGDVDALQATRAMISAFLEYMRNCGKHSVAELSLNVYGNYLVQKMFERASRECQQEMVAQLAPQVLKMCSHQNGCRVLQTVAKCASASDLCGLVRALRRQCATADAVNRRSNNKRTRKQPSQIARLLRCKSGNRVLQEMLDAKVSIEAAEFAFVKVELERDLPGYCRDANACRVVQSFLRKFGDELDLLRLATDSEQLLELCDHPHGNYVVQAMVDSSAWFSESPKIKRFASCVTQCVFSSPQLIRMCLSKQASYVVEKCLYHCDHIQRQSLHKALKSLKKSSGAAKHVLMSLAKYN